jgi:charged multivesicular body protein 5
VNNRLNTDINLFLNLKYVPESCTLVEGKIAELDVELKKCSEQLKKAGNTPAAANIKRRAMEVLKRKRMYEQQRDSISNQQFNIDQTAFAINTVKDTQTTVAAMKVAAKTLKFENKKIDINDLENMQDDMEGACLSLEWQIDCFIVVM